MEPPPAKQSILHIKTYAALIEALSKDRSNLGVCSIQLTALQDVTRKRDEILTKDRVKIDG